jgi:hypothetical protein
VSTLFLGLRPEKVAPSGPSVGRDCDGLWTGSTLSAHFTSRRAPRCRSLERSVPGASGRRLRLCRPNCLECLFSPGHSPGGFREWWRRLFGSDEHLDNTHLMRMAGRFSRRLYAFAKKRGIPVVHCSPGKESTRSRKHIWPTTRSRPLPHHGLARPSSSLGDPPDAHREVSNQECF